MKAEYNGFVICLSTKCIIRTL